MRIDEKLKGREFKYSGSREDYTIHDPIPNVLVLDPNYKGDSVLGYNLNYYKGNKNEIRALVNSTVKTEVKFYHKKKKLKRYKTIKEQFPFLSNYIRRYKKTAITKAD